MVSADVLIQGGILAEPQDVSCLLEFNGLIFASQLASVSAEALQVVMNVQGGFTTASAADVTVECSTPIAPISAGGQIDAIKVGSLTQH
jgi:hypothetical protein